MYKKTKRITVGLVFIVCSAFSQQLINESRKTAITKAIEVVGPAVACINVEQNVSAYSSPDPFFRYFFRLKFIQ